MRRRGISKLVSAIIAMAILAIAATVGASAAFSRGISGRPGGAGLNAGFSMMI